MLSFAKTSLLVAALAAAGLAYAQMKPETAIEYRQSIFKAIVWNFAPMGGMVRGARPFNRAEFRKGAERVASLSGMFVEGFPAGSATGAPTEAQPNIWTERRDFEAKAAEFQKQAALLAKLSAGTDEAAMKKQFGVVGGTCKACHDKFKAD
jgi:cytochrome c556